MTLTSVGSGDIKWKPRSDRPESGGLFLVHDGFTYYVAEYVVSSDSFFSTFAGHDKELGPVQYWTAIKQRAPSDETD